MDESWRMQMGIGMATTAKPRASLPRRRSTEETSTRRFVLSSDSEPLDPEDFSDVFGGPPRSVLCRQFAGGGGELLRPSASSFYEEVFRIPETAASSRIGGNRKLPEFRIPSGRRERNEGFYGDIFGKKGEEIRRSRSRSQSKSKSKSNSSSVLSSEDMSPLRPAIADNDVAFSVFASKLRQINVPPRWNSTSRIPEEPPRQWGSPSLSSNYCSYYDDQIPEGICTDSFRSSHYAFSRQVPSPETVSLDPNSYGSVKVSMDDLELNSPSSAVSSLCQDVEPKAEKMTVELLQEQVMEQDDDDQVMRSYVIEINSDQREGTEQALGIDEAIAWAKEKFQATSPNQNWSMKNYDDKQSVGPEGMPNAYGFSNAQMDNYRKVQFPEEAEQNIWAVGEHLQSERELELLDEDIKIWSAGKETNIQQLLSTLHHILWPNSGWQAIPITNLIENSHVKKAYQKARLCLHPDKVLQKGSTFTQKYVAEKASSILQEAWAAFISQDVVFS